MTASPFERVLGRTHSRIYPMSRLLFRTNKSPGPATGQNVRQTSPPMGLDLEIVRKKATWRS